MKIKTYIYFFLLINSLIIKGQDPQFSQFYSSPLYLAPSFAGLIPDTRISGNYRIQWPELPTPFTTYSFGLDHNFDVFNSGFGVFFLKDEAGSTHLTTTTLSLQYSYEFKISDYWYIRPGIDFQYTERNVDYNKLIFAEQISTSGISMSSGETQHLEKVGDIDAGASLLAYSDRFWFGGGVDHLLEPNQALFTYQQYSDTMGIVPIKYSVFGGTKIINKGKLINPYDASVQIAFLYRKQKDFNQFDIGLYWYKKPLVLGIWYRGMYKTKDKMSRDALILMTGYKLDMLNIGYSYDFTISRLIGSTSGSHEISLSYTFSTRIEKPKFHSVPCPDF